MCIDSRERWRRGNGVWVGSDWLRRGQRRPPLTAITPCSAYAHSSKLMLYKGIPAQFDPP